MARLQALLAQGLLDEFAHLAAPFADQADDDGVAVGVLGQHRQQHRLADAGAGEDAQALAAAGGGEDVHGAHAQVQPLADPAAGVGRRAAARAADRRRGPGAAGPCRRWARRRRRRCGPARPWSAARLAPSGWMRISAPGATPSTGPKGISRARVSRKPTTSAASGGGATGGRSRPGRRRPGASDRRAPRSAGRSRPPPGRRRSGDRCARRRRSGCARISKPRRRGRAVIAPTSVNHE